MSKFRVVSDTGPLITLEKLTDGYRFIARLYDQILVPPTVLTEVSQGAFDLPAAYLSHYDIEDLIVVQQPDPTIKVAHPERLHPGELQAIQLASQLNLPLLIEETIGRQVALQMGLSISGVAGQILNAYRQELISAQQAHQKLQDLLTTGRINHKIFEALTSALES